MVKINVGFCWKTQNLMFLVTNTLKKQESERERDRASSEQEDNQSWAEKSKRELKTMSKQTKKIKILFDIVDPICT